MVGMKKGVEINIEEEPVVERVVDQEVDGKEDGQRKEDREYIVEIPHEEQEAQECKSMVSYDWTYALRRLSLKRKMQEDDKVEEQYLKRRGMVEMEGEADGSNTQWKQRRKMVYKGGKEGNTQTE